MTEPRGTHGRTMLSPGDVLAGYEIEGYIARGGMAVVHRARDLSLGRRVALKLIAPELAGNDKFRQRFIRESELAASIDHPNVLPIYGAGEADGVLFIAMRFVDGPDLGRVLAEAGPLGPERVLPLFTQVAAALDTAHAHGLVHRDVKPGNILLARTDGEDHVYLTDFGLTKRSTSLSGYTTAGHFIGTIAYVAPEQIAGEEVTSAADVYAMGCVLYETLSGLPPFRRDDDAALLWAHMQATPDPLPGVPAAVNEVIARAMAKDPAERTTSCRAVVAELREAFRVNAPGAQRRPSPDSMDDQPSLNVPLPQPPAPGAVTTGATTTSTIGPKTRKAPWIAAVLAVTALLAAAFVVLPRWLQPEFVSYTGTEKATSWLAFDRPTDWSPHSNLSKTCFCTNQYGGVLETGDWANVIAAIKGGTTVEGLYAEQTRRLDLDDSVAVSQHLETFLAENRKELGAPVRTTIDNRSAWVVEGTLTASKDPTLKLRIRYLMVMSESGRDTDHIVLFTRDSDHDRLAERLDRVEKSIRFLENG
ncbi:serine/threonine-protein kinase [Kineosporia succinea]|uniref:non-specific serine/threonine protein kinase n=1 Tax=Kineosporia succinea TaxID=84632 RepID=A0ABT9P952_9ACTN|nr:serine/threonine-protein kinase [Kineosporia succinea]MDP9828690.1 serine/threonine protein kinase [Kineosporia succinea]